MKTAKSLALIAGIVLAVAGLAGATSIPAKQHYMSFGPFCISRSTGVMRAVRTGQACKIGEKRIAHKRIPLDPQSGPAGAAGKDGATGKDG